jgi:hypothetical protein
VDGKVFLVKFINRILITEKNVEKAKKIPICDEGGRLSEAYETN